MMLRSALSRAAATSGAAVRRSLHTSRAIPERVYDSILDTIGDTPIVKLNNIEVDNDVQLYAKCEFFNPLASVKDRLAIAVIEDAERSGALKPGDTIVEATSGNTGISLAMVCAAKGYPLVITMAESFSVERRRAMRAMGAKVVLTPAPEKGTGMVNKAKELAEKHGWFQPLQFDNPANPAYHASTTGAEILSDFAGKRLDYWVTGYGTGGTFSGAGKVIKAARPDTQIVLTEPAGAALVNSGQEQVQGESHPAWAPHPIQGWTPDFISTLLQTGLKDSIADSVATVPQEDAMAMSLQLAQKEGLFVGISAGATVATAVNVAKTAEPGSVIVAMLPDTAERYMSTPLFADIAPDMNEEELAISASTPSCQLPAAE